MTDEKDKWANNFPTSETKKITTIKLRNNEAALIMNSEGNVNIYLPYMDDDTDVPEHMQFISALAVATTDQEIIDLIWEKFYKAVDEVN